jgi:hypothetical protein
MAKRSNRLWNGKAFNLTNAGLRIGLSKYYFFSLDRDTYEYMQTLGKTPEEGFFKYREKCDSIRGMMSDIYFDLMEQKNISAFGCFLYKNGVYSHPLSFNGIWTSFFSRKSLMNVRLLERYKKIVGLYDEFKKECIS